MEPTHLLLLYYTSTDGMGWHRDSDKNDGDNDQPIVSISLSVFITPYHHLCILYMVFDTVNDDMNSGNSSTFGYKPLMRPEESVTVSLVDTYP
jgi:hypothetical protein